jgi:hypothetical protein
MSVIERERVEEIVAPRKVTVADDLNRAADLLESGEWGWCQGALRTGPDLCVLGAIAVATGYTFEREYQKTFINIDDCNPRYSAAFDALSVVVPSRAVWNDEPGRTKAEVISALRSAAERSL